jgi:DNA polymerase-3 subunit delta'
VIDQIRDLGAFVALVSHRGAERVVMIDPAEAMNTAAANALLKTLEEPPPAVRFILTSDRVDRLPATVRSRCRPVPVRLPPREAIERWLRSHTDAPESTIDAALAAAGGAPIEALSLLTGSGAQVREQIAAALAEIPDSDPLEIADRLSGHDPGPVFRTLHAWLVDLSRLLMGAQPIHFISWSARLIQLMDRTDASVLGRFEGALLQQLRWAEHPLNARLFIEDTLIGYRSVFKTAGTAPASDRHSRGHDRGHEVTRGGAPRKIG